MKTFKLDSTKVKSLENLVLKNAILSGCANEVMESEGGEAGHTKFGLNFSKTKAAQ